MTPFTRRPSTPDGPSSLVHSLAAPAHSPWSALPGRAHSCVTPRCISFAHLSFEGPLIVNPSTLQTNEKRAIGLINQPRPWAARKRGSSFLSPLSLQPHGRKPSIFEETKVSRWGLTT